MTAAEKEALETKKKILAMARDKERFENKHRVRACYVLWTLPCPLVEVAM